ncbi:MAG: hypothetical protein ACLQBD_31080 [Syntrophobacteraceae bacterium]
MPGGHSVWFTWTAPSSGWFSFDTQGSTFDTLLAVYAGTAVNQLSAIAYNVNNGSPDNANGLTFYAQTGTIYQITVDGYNGAVGNYVLNWGTSSVAPVGVPALGQWGPGLLCILLACAGWLSFRPRKDAISGKEEPPMDSSAFWTTPSCGSILSGLILPHPIKKSGQISDEIG